MRAVQSLALAAILVILPGGIALSLTLDEAKNRGLVGERSTGYLGVLNPGDHDAAMLAEDINAKRRQAYEEIARRNGTPLNTVETLAGEKAIQNTKPGHFIESGRGWT